MSYIVAAINSLRPGAEWSMNGDDPANIVWLSEGEAPTVEEIVAEADRLKVEHEAAARLDQEKTIRAAEVKALVVETSSGKVFDANEDAQNRMSRAISTMSEGEDIAWVLADNTVVSVSREELREALRLASRAQTDIWVRLYL